MAGTYAGFNQVQFEDGIRFAMQMGMPTRTEDRLTWHWRRTKTFAVVDAAGDPYDFGAVPVTDIPGNPDDLDLDDSVQVDYALEFAARPAGSLETPIGQFDTSRAVVTMLDTDYQQIKSADYCTVANARYEIDFTAPPVGLFQSTVWQVYLTAEDEV